MNTRSSVPVRQHAARIRRRGIFRQVETCLWKEDPPVAGILDSIQPQTVFVVPFFLSNGYFTQQIVPREFGLVPREGEGFPRVQNPGRHQVHYCEPVGTHRLVTSIILAHIEESLRAFFPDGPRLDQISVFLAAHGTERDAQSRCSADRQALLLSQSGRFLLVRSVFLEEEPRIASCYELAQSPDMVVVPFFLSEGMHTAEDLPELLGESRQTIEERLRSGEPIWGNPTERRGKRVWLTPAVGTAPGMVEVILDRVRQMASGSASGPARDDQG